MKGYNRIKTLKTIETMDFLASPRGTSRTSLGQLMKIHDKSCPSELDGGYSSTWGRRSSGFGAPKFLRNSSTSSSSSFSSQMSAVKKAFSMRRSNSSSSFSSQMSAVKKAFSMRRSNSSASERYFRIHDLQHVTLASAPNGMASSRTLEYLLLKDKRSASGGKKILQSCKRIFGL